MQMERDLKAWNGMRDEVLMAQFEGRMKEYARAKGAFEAVVRSHNRISSELSVERALTSRLLSQLEEEETRHDAALMEEKRRVRQIEVSQGWRRKRQAATDGGGDGFRCSCDN